VATSYFARASNLTDHPTIDETPSEWLEKTQVHLRKISKQFKKFEKYNKKTESLHSILEIKEMSGRIQKTLEVGRRIPFTLLKFFVTRALGKFQRTYL
jgi:hypothetical protein